MFNRYVEKQRLLGKGEPSWHFSPGMGVVIPDRWIEGFVADGNVQATCADGGVVLKESATGRWFARPDGYSADEIPTAMLGAVCGDVAGSRFERRPTKKCLDVDSMIGSGSRFTDDTVMTCAVAAGICAAMSKLPSDPMSADGYEEVFLTEIRDALKLYGNKYIHAGYGGTFFRWLRSSCAVKPYGSFGNGSAMRASFAGWAARSLEEAERLGELSAMVTHDHPEGIKGAVVTAGCIFLLRDGAKKEQVAEYAERYYNMDFTLDGIRPDYTFDVTCQGSVPQSIKAFLEGESFVDVIAKAISLGGDSDTMAAIAGSIAEVIYPIPEKLKRRVIERLDEFLCSTLADAVDTVFGGRAVD